MNKYMLILFEHENAYAELTPEEMQADIELHGAWIQELGDKFYSGEPLHQPAKTVAGKDKVVTDGPYIESKELVSGFYIVNANSMDEATELAKGCPVLRMGGKVEVREIMKF